MASRILGCALLVLLAACTPKPGSVEPDAPTNVATPSAGHSADAARTVKGTSSAPTDHATASQADERPPEPIATSTASAPEPALDLTFVPQNALVRIHYDARFTIDASKDNLTFLEPTSTSGISVHALVTVTTNPDPISQVPSEYANVLQGARKKALNGYSLLSMAPAKCFHDLDGIEARWVFEDTVDGRAKRLGGRACAFIHHKHGYSVMYAFDPARPEDEAKLLRIVEAVELTD